MSSSKMIEGKYSEKYLLSTAKDVVVKKTGNSKLLSVEAEARIPKFKKSELTLGRVLGRGGFCVVSEVTKIVLQKNEDSMEVDGTEKMDDEHAIYNVVQDRSFMETHCIRKGKDCRYALKKLQESSKNSAQTFINGVVDLAVEARFLSVIRHPNIIKMRAMANTSPYTLDFFVVLDRLYDILGQRIQKWKKQKPGNFRKLTDRAGKKESALWLERLTVAYDLASALQYLHDTNIIYRDLKPDNIGFDVRGDVKIFDFGLAKEIDPNGRDANGMYKLTGDTGSPRYMAVEIALDQPYNEKVDVYSFCILFWQILALETPFEGYTMSMFTKRVVEGGTRPKCDPKWSNNICDLMTRGWGDAAQRPAMDDVVETLRDEVNRNSGDEPLTGKEFLDISRKSELSLRGFSPDSSGGSHSKSLLSRRALNAMKDG